jgi:hypothetical protein
MVSWQARLHYGRHCITAMTCSNTLQPCRLEAVNQPRCWLIDWLIDCLPAAGLSPCDNQLGSWQILHYCTCQADDPVLLILSTELYWSTLQTFFHLGFYDCISDTCAITKAIINAGRVGIPEGFILAPASAKNEVQNHACMVQNLDSIPSVCIRYHGS